MGTCARQCSASAPQCPARADASWCTTLPRSACVRARASSAALWHCPDPQTSAGSGLLSGQHHRAAKWSTTGLKRQDRHLRRALPRLGRVNARLTQTPHRRTSHPRPRVCAPKRAARYCGAAQSTALRTLRAVARSTPQNRFCGQRAAVEACGFRSAFGKAGSHSQRFACVSQSAGALSPKDTARFASCSLAAVDH